MFKRIVSIAVLLIIVFSLTGCNEGIWFYVGYSEGKFGESFGNNPSERGHDLVALIHSIDELMSLCNAWDNPAYKEESPYYSSNLSKKIRQYDKEYFEEKALIVYLSSAANSGVKYKIRSLIKESDILFITIRQRQAKGESFQAIIFWTFLIEVKKAEIVDITDIQKLTKK